MQRVFEVELDLMLHVTATLAARVAPSSATTRPFGRFRAREERLEEVRERTLVRPKHVFHFFGCHWAEPAAALVPCPLATERTAACSVTRLLRLFVHTPVGAELVVLLALLRIAKHF